MRLKLCKQSKACKKNAGENNEKESDFLKTLVESVNNFNYQPNTSTKETPLPDIGTHPQTKKSILVANKFSSVSPFVQHLFATEAIFLSPEIL